MIHFYWYWREWDRPRVSRSKGVRQWRIDLGPLMVLVVL